MAADWRLDAHKKKNSQLEHNTIVHSAENYPIDLSFSHINEKESCYKVNINADKNWIFTEHLLTNIPTMVGSSYLETLMKWKEKEGLSGILTLRNSTFLSPLMIMKNMQRDLYLFCDEQADGTYKFTFKSTAHENEAVNKDGWQDHFIGELAFVENIKPTKIDIAKLKEKMPNQYNDRHLLTLIDGNNKPILQYSKRWDCKESTHVIENEWFTKISLPDVFKDDFSHFFVHPSMFDVATSCHFIYMKLINSYLPLSYGEVNIYAPFEKELYAYTKISLAKPIENQLSFDFQIFNLNGDLVVEVLNYSFIKLSKVSKVSNKSDLAIKELSIDALEDDILPKEGEQVLDTLLSNSKLSQVIVYTKNLQIDLDDSTHSVLIQKSKDKIKNVKKIEDIDDRPDIDTSYFAPENEIEITIAMIWTAILGINKIGSHDSFNSLGGNSLLVIQVVSGINEEFEVDMSTDEFVNNPTVSKLAELVLEKILGEHSAEELEKLLNE